MRKLFFISLRIVKDFTLKEIKRNTNPFKRLVSTSRENKYLPDESKKKVLKLLKRNKIFFCFYCKISHYSPCGIKENKREKVPEKEGSTMYNMWKEIDTEIVILFYLRSHPYMCDDGRKLSFLNAFCASWPGSKFLCQFCNFFTALSCSYLPWKLFFQLQFHFVMSFKWLARDDKKSCVLPSGSCSYSSLWIHPSFTSKRELMLNIRDLPDIQMISQLWDVACHYVR